MQSPEHYPQPNPVYQPFPKHAKTDWLSIAQLLFSIYTFLSALGMIGTLLFALQLPEFLSSSTPLNSLLLIALTSVTVVGVAGLSALYAIRRLRNRHELPTSAKRGSWIYWVLALWPAVIFAGAMIADRDPKSGLLPWLLALGLIIPALWLLRMGVRDLWGKFPQRDTGLFTFGAGFSLYFIMFAELIVIALLVVAVLLAAPILPGLQAILQEFAQIFSAGPQVLEDPHLVEQLDALFTKPGLLGLLILAIGVIAPLIEELFKPLGIWFLAGRKPGISASEGYAAGLFSGAAFGLVEGLLYGVQITNIETSGTLFTSFILGRSIGLLLHIFLSGLNGWALAKTWQDKRWGRAVGMLLFTTVIHGAWNSLSVLNGVYSSNSDLVLASEHLLSFIPLMLIFLSMLLGFFLFSERVNRENKAGSIAR
jgi:hypothetical protein